MCFQQIHISWFYLLNNRHGLLFCFGFLNKLFSLGIFLFIYFRKINLTQPKSCTSCIGSSVINFLTGCYSNQLCHKNGKRRKKKRPCWRRFRFTLLSFSKDIASDDIHENIPEIWELLVTFLNIISFLILKICFTF